MYAKARSGSLPRSLALSRGIIAHNPWRAWTIPEP